MLVPVVSVRRLQGPLDVLKKIILKIGLNEGEASIAWPLGDSEDLYIKGIEWYYYRPYIDKH